MNSLGKLTLAITPAFRSINGVKELVEKLKVHQDLTPAEIKTGLNFLLQEEEDHDLKIAFLSLLAEKGETALEMAIFVEVLREKAINPQIDLKKCGGILIDVCGTGADRTHTFNISTTSMFVVAGAGVKVAKHGNRSITSLCGGADVLEAMGMKIDVTTDTLKRQVEEVGLGFLFAPLYHPAFRAIAPLRKELGALGKRTIFNYLGPLLNPAPLTHQVIGLADSAMMRKYAEVLRHLGRKRAWLVHGYVDAEKSAGMDEISIMGPTEVVEVDGNEIKTTLIEPERYGFKKAHLEDLRGGDARTNAEIIESLLKNELKGPMRDVVVINAAAALLVTGAAGGGTLEEAIMKAEESLDSGLALRKLNQLRGLD